MRISTSFAIAVATLLLTSCQPREPDFELSLRSPKGNHVATVRGYEARGTIDSKLVLTFQRGGSGTFRNVENARVGWIADSTFAIVADKMEYYGLNSEYFSDGTVATRIIVVVCSRKITTCSDLNNRLEQAPNTKLIPHFPPD